MNFKTLQLEIKDAIGLLTLNRPETINALKESLQPPESN